MPQVRVKFFSLSPKPSFSSKPNIQGQFPCIGMLYQGQIKLLLGCIQSIKPQSSHFFPQQPPFSSLQPLGLLLCCCSSPQTCHFVLGLLFFILNQLVLASSFVNFQSPWLQKYILIGVLLGLEPQVFRVCCKTYDKLLKRQVSHLLRCPRLG